MECRKAKAVYVITANGIKKVQNAFRGTKDGIVKVIENGKVLEEQYLVTAAKRGVVE
jgi:hypothetical protein